jgi:lipid II:glycine glycyltransferase (peptidoglycan interpeptide bridge formation enzyme)
MGLKQIIAVEGAVRFANRIAKDILNSGDDPLKHVRDFEALWVRSDYAVDLAGLRTMYDDTCIAQLYGQSESEVRESVVSLLSQFVAGHSAV